MQCCSKIVVVSVHNFYSTLYNMSRPERGGKRAEVVRFFSLFLCPNYVCKDRFTAGSLILRSVSLDPPKRKTSLHTITTIDDFLFPFTVRAIYLSIDAFFSAFTSSVSDTNMSVSDISLNIFWKRLNLFPARRILISSSWGFLLTVITINCLTLT